MARLGTVAMRAPAHGQQGLCATHAARSSSNVHAGVRPAALDSHAPDAGPQLRAAHKASRVPVWLVLCAELSQVPLVPIGVLPQVLLHLGGRRRRPLHAAPWRRRLLGGPRQPAAGQQRQKKSAGERSNPLYWLKRYSKVSLSNAAGGPAPSIWLAAAASALASTCRRSGRNACCSLRRCCYILELPAGAEGGNSSGHRARSSAAKPGISLGWRRTHPQRCCHCGLTSTERGECGCRKQGPGRAAAALPVWECSAQGRACLQVNNPKSQKLTVTTQSQTGMPPRVYL